MPQTTAPLTQPGVYWFHSIYTPWDVMVEVALRDGQLSVFWLNRDTSLSELHGTWRGPVHPFSTSVSSA